TVARFQVQAKLDPHYRKPIYRIVRWQNWRGRRSSEDRFAQRVADTFKVVAYGSASGFHALKGLPPSPTVGLRKRLRAKAHLGLQVVDTPEKYTTATCSKCLHRPMAADPERQREGQSSPPRG